MLIKNTVAVKIRYISLSERQFSGKVRERRNEVNVITVWQVSWDLPMSPAATKF